MRKRKPPNTPGKGTIHMEKWFEGRLTRRILSLALSVVMVQSLLPMPSIAAEGDGLCEHHTEHTGCGYVAAVEGQECTHVCGEDCYTVTTDCQHVHDESCYTDGALPAAGEEKAADACTHECTEESGCVTKVHTCVHTDHDDSCGYKEAVAGSPCTFVCEECAGKEPDAPAGSQPEEPTAKVITDWAWIDEEEYLDEETGNLALPGACEETPASFDDVVSFLPYEVTATVDGVEETLTIDWVCETYPEDGAYEGEYTFTATLPEGYVLGEGVQALTVDVLLGGGSTYASGISYMDWSDPQKMLVPATCESATEVTGSTEDVTWPAGWYVVNQDVTFGSILKPVAVRAVGDIHLILADGATCTIYGRLEVNSSGGETDSLTIYGQSDQTGTLRVENVSHWDCSNSDGCDGTKGNLYFDAAIGGKCTNQDFKSLAGCDTKITINGGVVNASYRRYDHSAVIQGAQSGQGAAIGSGPSGKATITINAGDVTGTSDSGAGIGSGNSGESIVVINGGTVHGYSTNGAGIGIGSTTNYKTANIIINGGTVTGTSSSGAGIGSAYGQNTGGSHANIFINGGNVTGNSSLGAGIGSGTKTLTASIEISGGTVCGQGNKGAGIGSGENSGEATIKIKGGKVTAQSSTGAAIGSGNNADNDKTKITITGGEISASTEHIGKAGAAIGGSLSGNKVAEIVIRNATVYAKAGGEAPGIGDGNVTISNSTVQAYGGKYAAGIGSRQRTNSNTITIENSNVTAVGGAEGAAGIGTGNFNAFSNSAMGKITITDSTVNAKGTAGAAGIGGGARVQVNRNDIEISGGTVYACRGRGPIDSESQLYQAYDIGDGEIPTDQQGASNTSCKFTLPANGTAWVYLESDNNRKSIAATSGVILEKKQSDGGYETCTVYGTQSLSADYPIASGRSMTVTSDATLNTGNYGIYVQNDGTLKRDGMVNGSIYYPLTLTDCTADSSNTSTYGDSNDRFGKEGATISLKPNVPTGYKFQSWETTPANLITSGSSFKMPNQATTVEAKGTQVLQITQQPANKTITYGENVSLEIEASTSISGGVISYQWYKNSEKLSGETSKTLSLSRLGANTVPYTFYCEVTCDDVSINSDTVTVTVEKAKGSVEITGNPGKTYNGQRAELTTDGYSVTGDGKVTVEYVKKGGSDYSTTAPTNAGTYYVQVTMSESQNFEEASNFTEFTISKATNNEWQTEPYVTGFTYGDNVTNPVTYEAAYGNDDVVVTYKKKGTTDAPSNTVPTEAGTYDVTVTLEETNNYGPKLEATNLTLTIEKAASSVTAAPADAQSLYDGSPVSLVTAGTPAGGTMKYSLDGKNWSENIPTATEWGKYTVYYMVEGGNNHNDTEPQPVKAEIVPFKIQRQTETVEIGYSNDAVMSVTLDTILDDQISCQWYQVTDEGDVALTGETAKELTIHKPNAGKYTYVCKITCGDYFKYSTVPVEVTPDSLENVDLSGYWAEGGEREIAPNETVKLTNPSSRLLTKYTTITNDQGGLYPTGMQVFKLNESNNPEEISALENLLNYEGCSIRIVGQPGIRMITSLTKEAKTALTQANLAGYTLEEYGTVVQWAKTLKENGQSLTLSTGEDNYAYRKGVSDPVFANVGNMTQYTNVLEWESLTDEQYAAKIAMRPYIILSSENGETVTLYGGTVERSIYDVAKQNADTFPVGSAGYNYVHDIIDRVDKPNSSTNSSTGGNVE